MNIADTPNDVLRKLVEQRVEHQATIDGIGERRQRFAFAASQGDASARNALEQIEADEAAATSALKNLALAIREAEDRLEKHRRVENERAARERAADLKAKSEALVALDIEIVAEIKALGARLDERRQRVGDIAIALAKDWDRDRLCNEEPLGEALHDVLFKHLAQHGRGHRTRGAIDRLVAHDARILGVEHQPPSLSPVEIEMQRALAPRHPWLVGAHA